MRLIKLLVGLTTLLATVSGGLANVSDEVKQRGDLLADFLISGRGVVAKAQKDYQINDASIGDKGLSVEHFVAMINDDFREKTGIDIAAGSSSVPVPEATMKLLKIGLQASAHVFAENESVINMEGVGFKGFIPATYGNMMADIFQGKTGIRLKQTSFKYRNIYNAPDAFENKVLEQMAAPDYPKGQVVAGEDAGQYRVMKPIYIKQACLLCHGGPKGELDVAGRIKEGYREGELRGAISVSIATH